MEPSISWETCFSPPPSQQLVAASTKCFFWLPSFHLILRTYHTDRSNVCCLKTLHFPHVHNAFPSFSLANTSFPSSLSRFSGVTGAHGHLPSPLTDFAEEKQMGSAPFLQQMIGISTIPIIPGRSSSIPLHWQHLPGKGCWNQPLPLNWLEQPKILTYT